MVLETEKPDITTIMQKTESLIPVVEAFYEKQ